MEHNKQMRKTTPELAAQMRIWSNLGHWIIGTLLAIVSILALLEVLSVLTFSLNYIWPAVLALAGLALPIGILSHGHEDFGRAQVLEDPQQRQHLTMGGIMFLAGTAEIIALAVKISFLHFAWPLALGVVGTMFFIHPQHGTSEAAVKSGRTHRILGGTLIFAGLARLVAVSTNNLTGAYEYAWIILVLAAAAQLIFYREPKEAYETRIHDEH